MYFNAPLKPLARLYRRSLLLKAATVFMFLVDALGFFFCPAWALAVFVILHAVIFGFSISARCRFLNETLEFLE